MLDRTVIGVFDHFQNAERVISELEAAGFSRDEIGVLTPDEKRWLEKLEKMDARERPPVTGSQHPLEHDEVTNRVGTGAAIGGLTGVLLAVGALVIPGVEPVLAAGPLVAAIASGAFGAATGGLVGALSASGLSHEDANFYAEALRRGCTLVTVNASHDDAEIAASLKIWSC